MKVLLPIILVLCSFGISYSQTNSQERVKDICVYRVEGFAQGSTLNWEVSGGKILSENPTQTDSIVVEWHNIGKQQLSVYETNIYGCIGETYSIKVEVVEIDKNIELKIPNAFTPNNDGINDYFVIKSNREIDNYELIIINRWGNKLYESHSLSDSWDGKYKGKDCSPSTYFYIINYFHNGKKRVKKGCVELL